MIGAQAHDRLKPWPFSIDIYRSPSATQWTPFIADVRGIRLTTLLSAPARPILSFPNSSRSRPPVARY